MPIPQDYAEDRPSPQSARRIEAIWSFTASETGQAIVLPDGRCDIILRRNADAPDHAIPVVTGPATHPYEVGFNAGDQWFGIRLRPEHGVALWHAHLPEAVNLALRGSQARDHLPSIGRLGDADDAVAALTDLIHRANWPEIDPRLTDALDLLHISGGKITITALASRMDLSARHLRRLFLRSIGLDPKSYAQLVQFHRALRMMSTGTLSPTDVASEGGYADQAHMTRAFRRFGGFSPRRIPRNLSLPDLKFH